MPTTTSLHTPRRIMSVDHRSSSTPTTSNFKLVTHGRVLQRVSLCSTGTARKCVLSSPQAGQELSPSTLAQLMLNLTQVVPGYESMSGVANINTIAVAYGCSAITSCTVFRNMYNAIRDSGGRWQYTNNNFGQDSWVGFTKSGVIWHKNLDSGGYLVANPAREGNDNWFRNYRFSKRQKIDAP